MLASIRNFFRRQTVIAVLGLVLAALAALLKLADKPSERPFRECPHCLEDIPAAAAVCSYCTRDIA